MRAALLERIQKLTTDSAPLVIREVPLPEAGEGEVVLRVIACGVCHTELDEIEGRTAPPGLPVVPGHQVVGEVISMAPEVTCVALGDRVGVGWIWSSCGECQFCRMGQENLCPDFMATGRDADGGYAENMKVPAASVFHIPDSLTSVHAAPLLCAGAIGYRSLRLAGLVNGQRLGLTGFGGSGHLVLKMVRHLLPDCQVYVFARSGSERSFAMELGAAWAGDTSCSSPEPLHSIIDTTPVWKPVVCALQNLLPGGRLVINAIKKEDADREQLLNLDYTRDLWMEKEIKSVANVCRADIADFLRIAGGMDLIPEVTTYPLDEVNRALLDLKNGSIRGAKVLQVGD